MFIALFILATLPIVLLLIKLLFFWSQKVSKCIGYIHSKLYFNIYFRFGLEAYLELCLSSMIRFENYKWDNGNEKFHSAFATTIYLGLLVYLCFSLFFLQTNYQDLKSEKLR